MPRYLWKVQYTAEGVRGLLDEGGSARRAVIVKMVESVGGTIESCNFASGTHQLYVIGSVPDEIAAATLALRTAASGYARSEAIELLTPEQVDEAVRREAQYRAPGQ